MARERVASPSDLDPLALSDREDEIEAWLERSGTTANADSAATLASMGYTVAELDELTGRFPPDARAPLLSWLSSTHAANALLGQIGRCAAQISEVISALKSYSYMDQAPLQLIDVNEGLESTLVMLRSRLHEGGITVQRELAQDLPPIEAFGSELNQVWTTFSTTPSKRLTAAV